MKEADRVREVAEKSTGSAWREQEKWAKSLQGHLGSLSASWEKLATLSLNGDFVKGFIDATKGVLDLTSALGGLTPVLVVFTTAWLATKSALLQSFAIDFMVDKVFKLSEAYMASSVAMTTWSGIITGGVAFAIVGAIALFNHFHQSTEELQQQLNKTSEEYNAHKDNITKYSSDTNHRL